MTQRSQSEPGPRIRTFSERFSQGLGHFNRHTGILLGKKYQDMKEMIQNLISDNTLIRQVLHNIQKKLMILQYMMSILLIVSLVLVAYIGAVQIYGYKEVPNEEWYKEAASNIGQQAPSLRFRIQGDRKVYKYIDVYREYGRTIAEYGKCSKDWTLTQRFRVYLQEKGQLQSIDSKCYLTQNLEATFLGEAIKKSCLYEPYLQFFLTQISIGNSNAVLWGKHQRDYITGWGLIKRQSGLQTLQLYGFMSSDLTSPYSVTSFWEKMTRLFFPFFIDENGWDRLDDMLRGKGCWYGSGPLLTVGSVSNYKGQPSSTDFNLFVPSVIHFVFPASTPNKFNISIYGVRINYGDYMKKQLYISKILLGILTVTKTPAEINGQTEVIRKFFCESEKCRYVYSLVMFVSNPGIRLCSLKIDSVFAFDWSGMGTVEIV